MTHLLTINSEGGQTWAVGESEISSCELIIILNLHLSSILPVKSLSKFSLKSNGKFLTSTMR